MSSALDQSIVDLLRQSAVGSIVGRPVNDVLREMGLPALPQLPPMPPLPQMPPLPVLDLHALTKPITDLAASFGSGKFVGAPAADPTQVLSQVSSVMSTVVQLGSTAMQMASMLWQGSGASSAASSATQAASDGTALSGQGAQMSTGTAVAADSVFTGNALMTGITSKYLTSLAAAGPFMVTPPGQAFVLAMSTETLSEALGVVTKTRAELTAHSAKMAQTGHKVKVTNVPHGVSGTAVSASGSQVSGSVLNPATSAASKLGATATSAASGTSGSSAAQYISQALQLVQSLASAGGGAQSAFSAATPAAKPITVTGKFTGGSGIAAVDAVDAGATGGTGIGAGVSGGPGISADGIAESAPTLEAARTPTIMTEVASGMTGGTTMSSPVGTAGPGMMPMSPGAAGGLARAAQDSSTASEAVRNQLVTAAHGNEVVGPIAGVSLPVVGAVEAVTTTPDTEPPDKALTL